MRRHIRPPDGRPWEAPGFLFYTFEMMEWLGGYEPTTWREIVGEAKAKRRCQECVAKARAAPTKESMLSGWGAGTIKGLSNKGRQ